MTNQDSITYLGGSDTVITASTGLFRANL